MNIKKTLLTAALTLSTGLACADNTNLTVAKSALNVDETVTKLEHILQQRGLKIFGKFEHSRLAREAGLEMTDTVVVAFGAPKAGTPLMQCTPQIALELPLKFLIYRDGKQTQVAYEDISHVAARYGAQECAAVEKLSAAQRGLLDAVTQ